jgi:hypothetical protein
MSSWYVQHPAILASQEQLALKGLNIFKYEVISFNINTCIIYYFAEYNIFKLTNTIVENVFFARN